MAGSLAGLENSEAPTAGKTEPLARAVVLQGRRECLEAMGTPLHPAGQGTEGSKEDVRHSMQQQQLFRFEMVQD